MKKTSILPWFLLFILVAFLLNLGFWQLRRASEKESAIAQYQSRLISPILDLASLEDFDTWPASEKEKRSFAQIKLRGIFDFQHPVILLNKIHEHRLGFHILMPFWAQGVERPVLVHLGWLPHPAEMRHKKEGNYQELPVIPSIKGVHNITVYLSDLKTGWTVGPAIVGEVSWPLPMTYLDWATFEAAYHHKVAHYIALLSEQEEMGFIRVWHPVTIPPERHVAYAVQWFALAFTLIVIVGILQVRRYSKGKKG